MSRNHKDICESEGRPNMKKLMSCKMNYLLNLLCELSPWYEKNISLNLKDHSCSKLSFGS